jgi:hypothetical protein
MTKSELIAKRDATYREQIPEKQCATCAHYWMDFANGCQLQPGVMKIVARHAVCDLWERKEPTP